MKSLTTLKRAALVMMVLACLGTFATKVAAVTLFWNTNGAANSWTALNWGTVATGPFTTGWTNTSDVDFGANSNPVWVTNSQIGNVTVHDGFKVTLSPAGTLTTNGAVRTIDVGTGAILDLSSQLISTAAGTGFIKNGAGILYIANTNLYPGGFTLGGGTVILGTTSANVLSSSLTITGGTFAAKASTVPNASALNTMAVNGNFTMGAVTTGVTSGDAVTGTNMTLGKAATTVNLGGATRTISIGANGQYTMAGIISNGGLIIDSPTAATGRIILTSTASDYSGGTTIKTGATLSTTGVSSNVGFTAGPLGIGALTIDGGEYIPSSSGTNTIGNAITLNNVPLDDNDISVGGTSTLSGNITGAGGFRKGSSGILILSGANNYAGQTIVDGGTLALAKTQSFYNGVPASWTDANFSVNSGRTLVYAVGGGGEFTLAQFLQQATVGTGSGGFKDGSNIGIDTTNGGDQTIATVFTDNNAGANKLGLVKSGTNTLFLTNANTHSGPTIPAGGTLNLSNQLALQNSTLTTASGAGAVVFDQSVGGNAFTLGGLAGNGNLSLLNNAGSPAAIALTVGNNNVNATYSAALSGAGSLVKVGTAIQTLTVASSYTGGTTINAGTLAINQASAIGTGPLTLNTGATLNNTTGANITLSTNNAQFWNGNFTWGGSRALNLGTGDVTMAGNIEISAPGTDAQNNTLTVAGVISGSGFSITKSGLGRVNLSGQSTFDGGVKVIAGTVHAGEQSSNLGSGTGPLGTGTLELSGGRLITSSVNATVNTIENAIALTVPASSSLITSNGTLTLTGIISGPGGLEKSGNGTIKLANANTFSGDTTVASGATSTLNLSHQLALQNSTLIASSTGGFIAFDESVTSGSVHPFTLGGLSGDRNLALLNTALTPEPIELTVGNNNSDTTHTGVLSAGGSLVKVGSGKLTLGGNNSYSGTTSVNGGTLLINGDTTAATGAVTIASGATLGGTGTVGGAVTNNGTIAPGASVGPLNVKGDVINGANSIWAIELSGTSADLLAVTGNINLTAVDSLTVTGAGSGTSWIIATYTGTESGAFDTITSGYSVTYTAGNITLNATGDTLPGDFNNDGYVDAGDYVTWRKGTATPNIPLYHMGNTTTPIGPAQYDLWRQYFGTSNPSSGNGIIGGAASSVPEPTAWLLIVTAIAGAFVHQRRR